MGQGVNETSDLLPRSSRRIIKRKKRKLALQRAKRRKRGGKNG